MVVDADPGRTVDDRINQLDEAARQRGTERCPDDPVVFAIPKRNIETWLAFLRDGQVVDEEREHARKDDDDCQQLVERLAERCRRRDAVEQPSLALACTSFRAVLEP